MTIASPTSDDATGTDDDEEGSSSTSSNEYLFVEEVVFLHERGLLDCRTQSTIPLKSAAGNLANWTNTLDSSQLYQWLPKLGISLPMYFVYAHLRSQDFRVLRHAPGRLSLLQEQETMKSLSQSQESSKEAEPQAISTESSSLPQEENSSSTIAETSSGKKRKHDDDLDAPVAEAGDAQGERSDDVIRTLRLKVRQSIQNAPTPQIPAFDQMGGSGGLNLCWDCYQPSHSFAKTHPGIPDFYVAVTFFNESQVRFEDLYNLPNQGIPVKIATVSDSGSVLMFGLSSFGPPGIEKKSDVETMQESDHVG